MTLVVWSEVHRHRPAQQAHLHHEYLALSVPTTVSLSGKTSCRFYEAAARYCQPSIVLFRARTLPRTGDTIPSHTSSRFIKLYQFGNLGLFSGFSILFEYASGSHMCSEHSVIARRSRDTATLVNANTLSSASSVMYQPASSTHPILPYNNGHLPASSSTFTNHTAIPSDSESDLSDAIDPPSSTARPPPTLALDNSVTTPDQGSNDRDLTSDDALGSDDGEYDMEDSPLAAANAASSSSSRRSSQSPALGKRKAVTDEDDYMQNPELWGLRRSVRPLLFNHQKPLPLTLLFQGRARPSRRVVRNLSHDV